jgi:hypothetical protein
VVELNTIITMRPLATHKRGKMAAELKKVMAKPLVKHTDMSHEMSSETVEMIVGAIDKFLTSENFEVRSAPARPQSGGSSC